MQLMGATPPPIGSEQANGLEGGEAWAPAISINQEEVCFDTWVKLPRKAQTDLQDVIRRGLAGCDPEVGRLIGPIAKAHVAVQQLLKKQLFRREPLYVAEALFSQPEKQVGHFSSALMMNNLQENAENKRNQAVL